MTARGYDRKGKVLATIEHHLEMLEKHRVKIENTVTTTDGKTKDAKVDIEVGGDLEAAQKVTDEADAVEISFKQVGDNTFLDNPKAQAIVERFSKDAESDAETPKQTSLTEKKTLQPQMGRAPGNGQTALRDGAKSGSGTCLNTSKECAFRVGETAFGIYRTTQACALVAKNVVLVARCVAIGAAAGGPIGAIGAGLICGSVAVAKGTIGKAADCAAGVYAAQDGAKNVKEACTKECKSGGSQPGQSSPPATSSSSGSTPPPADPPPLTS
jgi:hypothetical protein